MKPKLFLLVSTVCLAAHLFAQVKTVKPQTQKTVVTTPVTNKITNQKPAKAENDKLNPCAMVLNNAAFNISEQGDGKKTPETLVVININDGNERKAAHYDDHFTIAEDNPRIKGHVEYKVEIRPYFPKNENLLLDVSVPLALEQSGSLPTSIMRTAAFCDFANGGSIYVAIMASIPIVQPIVPDIWKINSFTVYLSFDNDPASPHKMTWNGFTLSKDKLSSTLKFDKNFHPIQ